MNTQVDNTPIARAQSIKEFLDKQNIGYDDSPNCNFLVGPDPFIITKKEHNNFLKLGDSLKEWLDMTNKLCAEAYSNPEFAWLIDIIEGDVHPHAIKIHRKIHTEGKVRLPVFVRSDMIDLQSSAEAQIPGSGWGIMSAIHASAGENSTFIGLARGFGLGMKEVLGDTNASAAYISYNRPFYNEINYFCQCCQKIGIPLSMYHERVPTPEETQFARRPPLEDLLQYVGSDKLIEAHFTGDLFIEPDLSLLYDQKIAVAFPFDPRLKERYGDKIRELFPETFLIHDDVTPCFDGKPISWNDIAALSNNQRQFIVKYGGAKKGLRAGGKAVFNLSTSSHKDAKRIIDDALADWRNNKGSWLIQRRVIKKFGVNFLSPQTQQISTEQRYALFRPMYLLHKDNNDFSIIFNHVLLRKGWKVHGASDAVILPIKIVSE